MKNFENLSRLQAPNCRSYQPLPTLTICYITLLVAFDYMSCKLFIYS
jgi:hypothetical protein